MPYDALLDRYSSIDTKGNFLSSIKNKEKRLGLMLGGLIRGRVSVAFGCDINMRNGLTIALRFSAIRKQFTNSTGPENYLLDYQLQKYRLIPHLARMLATRPAVLYITRQYKDLREKVKTEPECEELAEFHALLSVIKAMSSWYSVSCMQVCRETTGGLGYSAYAGLARIRSGNDVQVTWEGDNYVLIQQSGKFLLKQATKIMNGVNIKSERTKALNINFDQVKAFRVSFETKEQLLNVDLLISLFVHRLNYTLSDCMVKLQENLQVSTDMVLAWNNSQIHYVQDMSKAYGELFLLTEFKNSLQALTAQDENTGNTIKKFFYLYALYTLQDNLVTFLGESMTKNQAVLIRKTVVELCDELGESSLQVIDALAAPDESLGSVIGVADGQIYEKMIETVENSKRVYEKPAWLPILRDIRDKGLISNN